MEEQYRRFCEVYSTNCERCPIAEQCQDFSAQLPPEDNLNSEYSYEAILFRYVMTGETPSTK